MSSKTDNKNHETMGQEEFMKKIGDLIAAGKQNKGVLEESEIRAEFKNLKLTDDQYELIVRVLEKNDIDVLQVVDDDDSDVPEDELDMIEETGEDDTELILKIRSACTSRRSAKCRYSLRKKTSSSQREWKRATRTPRRDWRKQTFDLSSVLPSAMWDAACSSLT